MKEESQKELIHYILQHMLNEHFKTKTRMAKVLNVELRTIQKTCSLNALNSVVIAFVKRVERSVSVPNQAVALKKALTL